MSSKLLSKEQAQNALILLERVQITGKEVPAFVDLRNTLVDILEEEVIEYDKISD